MIYELDDEPLFFTGDLSLNLNLSLFQEEETAVPWSGAGGEQVQYGGMYYPPQAMHYPMGNPVSMVCDSFWNKT